MKTKTVKLHPYTLNLNVCTLPNIKSIVLEAQLGPLKLSEAMAACAEALTQASLPEHGRVGLVGDWGKVRHGFETLTINSSSVRRIRSSMFSSPQEFHAYGITWNYDARLGSGLIAAWHPSAVIPPVTVLREDGIVYCTVK